MKTNRNFVIGRILIFLSICCLLYPLGMNYYNSMKNQKSYVEYQKIVSETPDFSQHYEYARQYNQSLFNNPKRFEQTDEAREKYLGILKVSNGLVGYVEVPKINVQSPIYYGTDEITLSYGIGHFMGSSFPVGDETAHTVLSGHTGMASQIVLTDLDKLDKGDIFYVTSLDTTYTYTVDDINIVEPTNSKNLGFDEGKNYCTLLTCYPLGVGDKRLLVRGVLTKAEPINNVKYVPVEKVTTTMDKITWLATACLVVLIVSVITVDIVRGSKQYNYNKKRGQINGKK